MNKKRLLIVAHHLTIGGVQKSLISALKAIDYDKFDVTVYLRKNRTDLLPFVDERVNVIINDDTHHYYRMPYAILLQMLCAVFKLLGKKETADVFNRKLTDFIVRASMEYEHKRFFINEKYDIAIAYVQGYTALFTANCVDARKKYLFFHTSVDELHSVHEKIIDKFHKIVAIHDEQKELIKTWYPQIKDRICVVENYCDSQLIRQQSSAFDIENPEDKLILCSCGRFTKVKGFDLAVEAAKLLKERNVSFIWFFVGDGPERANIEELIKKYNLSDDIIITGMQKNPYPYINVCDVFVQPSCEESLGITILESHRLEKPVIATKTLGGTKLIKNEENGLVAEIDAASLADNIMKLINDKQLMNNIINKLKSQSYLDEINQFKAQWQNLLEE